MMAKYKPNNTTTPPPVGLRAVAPNPAKAIGDFSERKGYVERFNEAQMRAYVQTRQTAWLEADRKFRRGLVEESEVKRAHGAYLSALRDEELSKLPKRERRGAAKRITEAQAREVQRERHASEALLAEQEMIRANAEVQSLPKGSDERRAAAERARKARALHLSLTGGVERRELEVAATASSWDERK